MITVGIQLLAYEGHTVMWQPLQSQDFDSLDGSVEQAGVLVLKGSLVMPLLISLKLHIGRLFLLPQLPLCLVWS